MPPIDETQFTADELAIMNGTKATAAPAPEPADEAAAGPAAADAEGEPAAAPAAPADAPAAASDAEEAEGTDEPKQFVPEFNAKGPENYADAKKAIRDDKTALRAKWSSGDLSDDEFAAQEAVLDDKLEAMQTEFATAQALATANQQIQAQLQRQTLMTIANDAKRAGIDYADPGLAAMYDAKMKQVSAEADFAGTDFAEVAQEAHARVMALFGKTPGAAGPAPAPAAGPAAAPAAPAPAPKPQIPQTLSNLPAAAQTNIGQDIAAQLASIDDPDVREAKLASMPVAQRQALLRSTMPAARR
jgi:pyruvate dehydrogenase E2 component (dihydrolipoamide acetyltransferase)